MAELSFKSGSQVVYPPHGVGEVTGVENQAIAGQSIETYVVKFERDKMTLRIPVSRALKSGLRPLCESSDLDSVKKTLQSKAKVGRGMWSRRAKEYETKINSGNIVSLAEVVRDLHKNVDDPDRSYSERMIYESALDRLVGEVSAVRKIALETAQKDLIKTINDSHQGESEKSAEVVPLKAEDDDFFEEEVAA